MIFKIKGGKDDMNQQNKIHVGIHHGARELENNILLQSIPGLKDLHTNIEQFRNVAFNYNNLNKGNSFIKMVERNLTIIFLFLLIEVWGNHQLY